MRIIIIIGLIILSLLLMGCSTAKPIEVDVPIPINEPEQKLPPKPHLPIQDLTKSSTSAQTWKAYVMTVKVLVDHVNECHEQIEGDL